jgi:hypothetical protein
MNELRYAKGSIRSALGWLLHDALIHPITGMAGFTGRITGSLRLITAAHHVHNATAPSNDVLADYAAAMARACKNEGGENGGADQLENFEWFCPECDQEHHSKSQGTTLAFGHSRSGCFDCRCPLDRRGVIAAAKAIDPESRAVSRLGKANAALTAFREQRYSSREVKEGGSDLRERLTAELAALERECGLADEELKSIRGEGAMSVEEILRKGSV